MINIRFITFLVALAAMLSSGAFNAFAENKPNIVFLLADDLGLGDVSFNARNIQKKESVVETPNFDALAAQGMWFTDGHSPTALCAPSRYAIMSGKNNYRCYAPPGVWSTFAESPFKPGEATLGTVVRDAGYATAMVGKWHMGGDFYRANSKEIYRGKEKRDVVGEVDLTQWAGSGPKSCGFNYSFLSPTGIQGPVYLLYENEKWSPWSQDSKIVALTEKNAKFPEDLGSKGDGPGDTNWDARYLGDILSSKVVDFIKKSAAEKKPFFVYYCSPLVHAPHRPPVTFDGEKIAGTTPSPHLDMVRALDLEVKRIVDALKETGQFENTLFVVSSDNGGLGDAQAKKAGYNPSGDWSGAKGSPLEGGHRIPFFAVWPGHIKPGISDQLVSGQDMVATFAALIGTKIPAGQADDSNNILPLLTGNGEFKAREYWMHQAGAKQEVMLREWPWKLVIQSDYGRRKFKPAALYNLADDPKEKRNRFNDPEQAERVKAMFKKYMETVKSGVSTVAN